jgi:hypothetical protein
MTLRMRILDAIGWNGESSTGSFPTVIAMTNLVLSDGVPFPVRSLGGHTAQGLPQSNEHSGLQSFYHLIA